MKKLLLFVTMFILICSSMFNCQETDNEKRTRFFNNYMKETFPNFKITDGEYLFILQSGCINCVKSVSNILLVRPEYIKGGYKAILISQSTLNSLSDEILKLNKHVLCDKTNKLDKMSFGIYGIAIIKIRNKKIIASKSLIQKDIEKGIQSFFTPL